MQAARFPCPCPRVALRCLPRLPPSCPPISALSRGRAYPLSGREPALSTSRDPAPGHRPAWNPTPLWWAPGAPQPRSLRSSVQVSDWVFFSIFPCFLECASVRSNQPLYMGVTHSSVVSPACLRSFTDKSCQLGFPDFCIFSVLVY